MNKFRGNKTCFKNLGDIKNELRLKIRRCSFTASSEYEAYTQSLNSD
jgi:hypothetical protein